MGPAATGRTASHTHTHTHTHLASLAPAGRDHAPDDGIVGKEPDKRWSSGRMSVARVREDFRTRAGLVVTNDTSGSSWTDLLCRDKH